MKKYFIITIDTEGDNLWHWKYGDKITSKNARFLPRFQFLCEEYGFKPVYLTNYEMAIEPYFVSMAKEALRKGTCEIGMHLHAVNNPPVDYKINVDNPHNFPYLIEYPDDVMEAKIAFQTRLLEKTFGRKIVTHRAGRWAMDKRYEELLLKYGYQIDCSTTPGIDWSSTAGITNGSMGTNYDESKSTPYFLDKDNRLLEVPITTKHIRKGFLKETSVRGVLRFVKHTVLGRTFWLRPTGENLDEMLFLLDHDLKNNESDYIMFMLHSSEFMPGGSPTFLNEKAIETLYEHIRIVFDKASKYYEGITLEEYARKYFKRYKYI